MYEELYCYTGNHYFTRRVVRGRKPETCAACKRAVQDVLRVRPVRPRRSPGNLVLTDGGKSDDGFTWEQNDCTVRAVAVACEVPYKDAYTFMARNGRRKNKGAYFHSIVARNKDNMMGRQFVYHGVTQAKGIKTFLLRNPQMRKGTWVLHMTRHVAVLKDGVLMDSFDSSRKVIDGAWRVV